MNNMTMGFDNMRRMKSFEGRMPRSPQYGGREFMREQRGEFGGYDDMPRRP